MSQQIPQKSKEQHHSSDADDKKNKKSKQLTEYIYLYKFTYFLCNKNEIQTEKYRNHHHSQNCHQMYMSM